MALSAGSAQRLTRVLGALAAGGQITGWTAGIYEPEIRAFGGAAAMDISTSPGPVS